MPTSIAPAQLGSLDRAPAHPALPGLGSEFPLLLDRFASSVRVVYVPHEGLAARDAWLQRFFPDCRPLPLRVGEFRHLAQSDGGFTLMIISAEDIARICDVVRDVREVFANKLVVPLLSACSPDDRAYLLERGADEVLHPGMPPVEGAARLSALLRRAEWVRRDAVSKATVPPHPGAETQIEWLCSERLNPQEHRVLAALYVHLGAVVPHQALRRAAQTTGAVASQNSLKVIIFRIRRRLKAPFVIRSVRGLGLVLERAGRSERDPPGIDPQDDHVPTPVLSHP